MAERDQEALQKGLRTLGDNIDKLYARPLQKAAYLCMAKCNDNITMSSEAVNACMRRCEQPLQGINQVVQQEVGGMQITHLRQTGCAGKQSFIANKFDSVKRCQGRSCRDLNPYVFIVDGVCENIHPCYTDCGGMPSFIANKFNGANVIEDGTVGILTPASSALTAVRLVKLNRLQRCTMDCADDAKDSIPAGAKEGDAAVERAMAQNAKCAGVCVKKHLALMPGIEAKIKAAAEAAAAT